MRKELLEKINIVSCRALDEWGVKAQMLKTIEECSELMVNLAKFINGSPILEIEIIDEIADVLFMAHQMRLALSSTDVDARLAYKLERTERKLNELLATKPETVCQLHGGVGTGVITATTAAGSLLKVCAQCWSKLVAKDEAAYLKGKSNET